MLAIDDTIELEDDPRDDDNPEVDSDTGDDARCKLSPRLVYFLTLVDPDEPERDLEKVKVGITAGSIESRIAGLQTGNPYRLRCVASFLSSAALEVEHWVHQSRATRRIGVEWLRLSGAEIPGLVEAAKCEALRLESIAEATEQWSRRESNGKIRTPTSIEREIYAEAVAKKSEFDGVNLRLVRTTKKIYLAAGPATKVAGIFRVRVSPPSKAFCAKLACANFPALAAAYMVEYVHPYFHWSGPRSKTAETEVVRDEIARLAAAVSALDATLLEAGAEVSAEGLRTSKLVDLHGEYLELKEQKTRLELDVADARSRIIISIEDCDTISDVCIFRRVRRSKLSGSAFRQAHPGHVQQCMSERKAFVARPIYGIRSY